MTQKTTAGKKKQQNFALTSRGAPRNKKQYYFFLANKVQTNKYPPGDET